MVQRKDKLRQVRFYKIVTKVIALIHLIREKQNGSASFRSIKIGHDDPKHVFPNSKWNNVEKIQSSQPAYRNRKHVGQGHPVVDHFYGSLKSAILGPDSCSFFTAANGAFIAGRMIGGQGLATIDGAIIAWAGRRVRPIWCRCCCCGNRRSEVRGPKIRPSF